MNQDYKPTLSISQKIIFSNEKYLDILFVLSLKKIQGQQDWWYKFFLSCHNDIVLNDLRTKLSLNTCPKDYIFNAWPIKSLFFNVTEITIHKLNDVIMTSSNVIQHQKPTCITCIKDYISNKWPYRLHIYIYIFVSPRDSGITKLKISWLFDDVIMTS